MDHVFTKTNQHVKYDSCVIFVNKKEHCDLDLWPSEPKIKLGHVRAKTNQHVKYDIFVIQSS